jgi:hypothetical protein
MSLPVWLQDVAAIRDLRRRAEETRGSAQIDFETDVAPLLLREMGCVYRCVLEQRDIPNLNAFTQPHTSEGIQFQLLGRGAAPQEA